MFAKVLNYLILVFLLLIAKAPVTWGFSISRTQSYIESAQKQALWKEDKWLYLGHYEKKLLGYRSSFRGPLFIDPEGYNSPEKELLASVQALFSDSKELTEKYKRPAQCQFLARRKWLIKKLNVSPEDILPCEERETWKKQLGATQVTLVFASSDLGNPASSFGHTFLKLVNPANAKNKDLLDYGVNYAADADQSEGLFYAVKGLFGMYGGRYTMLPYHQKIREYVNLEGRDIWEYNLNFTPEETDELINHLLEMENSSSPYYFFSDNCSLQILATFDAVRPEMNLSRQFKWWVIPIDTVKTIARKSELIINKKFKKSLKADYLESYRKLGLLQKKALDVAIEKYAIPADYELTPLEKAEVYETAMKYLAVKAYRTQTDLDEEKYKLSTERAMLGQLTNESEPIQIYSPEQSHDSSAIYLGYGQTPISDYSSFKFRASYHDLEQTDAGAIPFSQNNLGTFELRYYSEIKKLSIERATLINLINTNPITPLDRNISWKVRAELLDQWRPDAEFSGGLSFDLAFLGASRISYFLTGRYYKAPDRHVEQAGPEILFATKPADFLGASMSVGYFAEYESIPYLRFTAKLDYQLAPNYDVQIQANDRQDYQINFLKNFIF